MPLAVKDVPNPYEANVAKLKPPPDPMTTELIEYVRLMSPEGVQRLIERAAMLAEQFPRAKANPVQ